MKKHLHMGVFVLLISLVLLGGAFIALNIKVGHDSDTPFTVNIDASQPQGKNEYTINTIISKNWINDEGQDYQNYGAQYDTTVRNNTDYDIIKWKITIDVPEKQNIIVDSYWNGDYKFEDGKIIFTAGEKVDPIPPGQDVSFGAVIISDGLMKLDKYEFTGCKDKPITHYFTFWAIMVLFIVWSTSVVAYIIYRIREAGYERNERIKDNIISQAMNAIANLVDAKDPYTKGHSTRVSYYTQKIAEKMGLHETEVKNLGYIALMHDCGKIGIPDNILTKPARLTDEEFKIMQGHTTYGGKALEEFTSMDGIVEGALYHHERYDGKGYPKKLKGENIPLYARIIGVADALDAMNSDRCYRPHLKPEVIKQELKKNSGSQFDPDIVECALELIEDGVIKLGTDKDKK
ncbi:MAG: HD domain-containing protein [Ruminococcus sp.]|nr:HD domain-containing protein [Ruminococcus sp.]MBQ1903086.1 HD domain-containing protein [Ruminococcus sp.]MBQ3937197.1 HD domain-containing protein [Ruminococcus sp.]